MPGIGSIGPMGGMTAMNGMYQTLAANRRQNNPAPQTEAAQQALEASAPVAEQTPLASAPERAPAPARELPAVEALNNASDTLAQMRVRYSDTADEAFEQFRAETAPTQGAEQTPPAARQEEGGEIPDEAVEQAPLPPESGVSPREDTFSAPSAPQQAENAVNAAEQLTPPEEETAARDAGNSAVQQNAAPYMPQAAGIF